MKSAASTKEEIKSKYLDVVAGQFKIEWHSQEAHKVACGLWMLDTLEIKDPKKRTELLELWVATPGSFGTNNSALGQALGRPKNAAAVATARVFDVFNK